MEIAHLKELINLKRENTSVGLNAILQYTIGEYTIAYSLQDDFIPYQYSDHNEEDHLLNGTGVNPYKGDASKCSIS